ncbi:SGNH/GDSL hydrolase family protein, partial [Peterkaempfera griseoplana]|uniref:SGNH/GDSL hydrolase family protein n=1 Tax=Peterkaempfera griseoplana TaxID=66896 RepID=UPI00099E911D
MLHPVSGPALGTLPPRVITLGEAMARGVRQTAQHWVTGWAAGQVAGAPVPGMAATAAAGVRDCTVRNAVFLSAGGGSVRVRLSNTFGDRPVAVDHATVAVRSQGADAVPGTMRALTFSGSARTVLAAGGTLLSDPVALAVAPLSTLLVSVFVPGATGPLTHHPFTAATNYLADGDAAPSTFGGAFRSSPCWLLVSAVEVLADARTSGTVVAFGDSITDTARTTGDLNRRYPDRLARRLAAREGRTLSVVNAGLGGNCLLGERTGEPHYGPSGLSRMERDIFAHSGVRAVILLEGI